MKGFKIALVMATIVFMALFIAGCGNKGSGPPHGAQPVQLEGDYLSEGYDVYLAIAFPTKASSGGNRITGEMVNDVLDYYYTKYKDMGKVKVIVFKDNSAALLGVSDLALGELEMNKGEVIFRNVTPPRL